MPFGPEVSWPDGHSGLEYQDDPYAYPAPPGQAYQAPAAYPQRPALPSPQNHGEHPYATYSGGHSSAGYGDSGPGYAQPPADSFGYGDPGYSNPGYDGPAAQDAGVASTRTVRGFVESGYQDSYGQPGGYSQPWDYSQPLRYDDEPAALPPGRSALPPSRPALPPGHPSGAYPVQGGGYTSDYAPNGYDGYGDAGYGDPSSYDSSGYQGQDYDSGSYNGSELSRPGIDGLGYDISEIIGTKDFPSFGYDEPSVERLSYDDPRYDDGYGDLGSRYEGQRFDETRLDNFWPDGGRPGGGHRGGSLDDGGPAGFGQDRSFYGNDGPGALSGAGAGGRRNAETRLDMGYRADQARFDAPALGDETRLDMFGVMEQPQARVGTGLLERPASWADETSLDSFAGLDLDEMPVGFRPESSRAVAAALQEAPRPVREDTGSQRGVGRRRGRSSDRRQWMALAAVGVVAVGAIGMVLSKFAFGGPSGPAHTISTPTQLDGFTRSASLEKAMDLAQLRAQVVQGSSGQASDIQSAVYSQGNMTPGAGGNQQIFMFVGGHLANSDPASSISSFEQQFPSAQVVNVGTSGGEAACTTTTAQNESVSMCAWFDNDSFGTLVSPTMTTAKLATTMDQVRSGIEQVAK